MADNRDFFNALQNEGGSPTYCEDKKLSEISAKTTVGTDGVMLKGTDGAYYEIDKASLSEVIRAELGAILADNSKNNGTSVGKVPTLNSTGNALGASSVADLASVLGGKIGVEVKDNVQESWFDDITNRVIRGVKFEVNGSWFALGAVAWAAQSETTDLRGTLYYRACFAGTKYSTEKII